MTIVFMRTVIIYLIVLFVMRIMGKAELSKMSPFQLVVVFMIAELAAIPIESPDISMITGVTAIFTLMLLQVSISFISLKSERFKNFFSGRPSVLIEHGSINQKELKALRITINDLVEQLRIGGSPSISDVEFAIMESNGDLSIIPKAGKKPLTPEDMSVKKDSERMPVVVISDGVLYRDELERSGLNSKQLSDALWELGIPDHKRVFLAFCDEHAKLHVFMTNSGDGTASEVTGAAIPDISDTKSDVSTAEVLK